MRVRDLEAAKQMTVGPETVRRGTGVSPIVLGTGDAESISQTIKLLWIDRMDAETPIQKHIHDRPMWHLDRDRDRACRTRNGLNPIGQLCQAGAAMPKFAFARNTTSGIENADLMFPALWSNSHQFGDSARETKALRPKDHLQRRASANLLIYLANCAIWWRLLHNAGCFSEPQSTAANHLKDSSLICLSFPGHTSRH